MSSEHVSGYYICHACNSIPFYESLSLKNTFFTVEALYIIMCSTPDGIWCFSRCRSRAMKMDIRLKKIAFSFISMQWKVIRQSSFSLEMRAIIIWT